MQIKIDMHRHIWRREHFTSGGLSVASYGDHDTDLGQFMRDLDEAGIDKAVVIPLDQTRFAWGKYKVPDIFIRDFVVKHPDRLIGFSASCPLDERSKLNLSGLQEFETSVKDFGLKGLKLFPVYSWYYPNDTSVYPFYEKAQELGVPVMLHQAGTNAPFARMKYGRPIFLEDVAIDFPKLNICACHMGYPWTEELFALMRKCSNVWTDLAAIFIRPTVLAWNLVLAKEYNIIDRVMFGTDYPFFKPTKDMSNFVSAQFNTIADKAGWPGLSQSEIDGILGNNARRFLRL